MCYNVPMDNFSWVFDGIGTAIVTFLLGLVAGSGAGIFIGIRISKIKNHISQKGRDNLQQTNIGEIVNNGK